MDTGEHSYAPIAGGPNAPLYKRSLQQSLLPAYKSVSILKNQPEQPLVVNILDRLKRFQ